MYLIFASVMCYNLINTFSETDVDDIDISDSQIYNARENC